MNIKLGGIVESLEKISEFIVEFYQSENIGYIFKIYLIVGKGFCLIYFINYFMS